MRHTFVLVCSVLVLGCGVQQEYTVADASSDGDSDSDTDSDTDSDIDTDSDTDTDVDTDTDSDSDADTDTDAGTDSGADSDTDTDTDTDTDSDTEVTICETADECSEDYVCGWETHTCYPAPTPESDQFWYCWDDGPGDELSCDSHDFGGCDYWSPADPWNWFDDPLPGCVSNYPPPACPTGYPLHPACCLKNNGESACIGQSFFPHI
jgi:hypothetical protein